MSYYGDDVPAAAPSDGPAQTPYDDWYPALASTLPAAPRVAPGPSPRGWIAPYLVGLGAAGWLEANGHAPAAGWVQALITVSLLVLAGSTYGAHVAELLTVLAAASTVRLIVVTLVMPSVTTIGRTAVGGLFCLMVCLLVVRANGRPPDLRRGPGGYQLLVAAIGIPLGVLAYLTLSPRPVAGSGATLVETAVVVVLLGALPEEMLFRGLLTPTAAATYDTRLATGLEAAVYASWYAGAGLATIVVAAAFGAAASLIRQRTGRLGGVVLAHALANLLTFAVLARVLH